MEKLNKYSTYMSNKMVVVLCMHRSGSSLIAGLLHHMGVNMGPNCDWKSYDNPKGFYEDREIVYLNEHILSFYNSTWFIPPTSWIDRNMMIGDNYLVGRIFHRIRTLIKERDKNNKLWGWKDPRTVFTFPLYEPYLRNYIFICPQRNQDAIAKSLQNRNHFDYCFCIELIDKYDKARKYLLNKYKVDRYYISYDNLISGDYHELVDIAKYLKLTINKNILNMIDRKLKHS